MALRKELSFFDKLADTAQAMLASTSFKFFLLGIGIILFCLTVALLIRKMNRLKKAYEVADEASKLEKFVDSANHRIKVYEKEFRDHLNFVSAQGAEALSISTRILNTLENRLNNIEGLLKKGSEEDIIRAQELLNSRLQDNKNSLNNVISADPVPELAPEEWMPAINKLIETMDKELNRVEKIAGKLSDSVIMKTKNTKDVKSRADEEKKYRRRLTFRSLVKHLDS